MTAAPVRAAMLLAALAAGVTAGVAPARIRSHQPAISRDAAIAAASRDLPMRAARLVGAERGAFDEFWAPGSEDFAAPRDARVWAVTFRGVLFVSCGPVPPPGNQKRCPMPVQTMMMIVDANDGAFIEGMAPAPTPHSR